MADKFEEWWKGATMKTIIVLSSVIVSISIWVGGLLYNQNTKQIEGLTKSIDGLKSEVVTIRLSDSANNVRLTRIEEDIFAIKVKQGEDSTRIGRVERKQSEHSQMLKEK